VHVIESKVWDLVLRRLGSGWSLWFMEYGLWLKTPSTLDQ